MNKRHIGIVVIRDGRVIASRALESGSFVVGSGPSCAIVVKDDSVSPEHAKLHVSADETAIEDLGSEQGTFVGEERISGRVILPFGKKIRLGKVTLETHPYRDDERTIQMVDSDSAEATLVTLGHLTNLPATPGGSKPQSAEVASFVAKYSVGPQVAAGGMGAIMQAQDLAIRRAVAMKLMLEPGRGDETIRFIAEAQVTGQLEHPNIVPVHDIGTNDVGHPFYTMKFVRGHTLKAIITGIRNGDPKLCADFPLARLLTIFQKVCDAIAFAHARGVIHRDLKPDNIMIGDFGEVLVMDWGLAKVLGAEAPQQPAHWKREGATDTRDESINSSRTDHGETGKTISGFILGTPNFMSPEQARGEVEKIDARSDIFALGALLYVILTFDPPFAGGGAEAVLEKVRRCEMVPPVAATAGKKRLPHLPDGRVPESLSAVVMKAMALKPEDRYQTVLQLQRELEAYQNGFATAAENASLMKQIALLVRRNQREFTIGAAAVLLLVTMTVWFVMNLRASERRANQNATLAQKNADEANSQSLKAIKARSQAEDVLEFLVYDMRDELIRVGRLELAEKVRTRVDKYYSQLGLEKSNSRAQRNRVAALNNEGDLALSKGDLGTALKSYRDAVAIAGERAAAEPKNTGWQRDLIVCDGRIGEILQTQGDLAGALKMYRDAFAINERTALADPTNLDWQRDLGVSGTTVGDVLRAQGDLDGALKTYRDALAIAERLTKAEPANVVWQRDLCLSHNKVGAILREQGNLSAALAAHKAALAVMAGLVAADAANAALEWDMAGCHIQIGDVLFAQNNLDGALRSYGAAYDLRKRLAAADPKNAAWQRDLSVTDSKMGDALRLLGDLPGALKSYRETEAILQRLVEIDAANAGWQWDLSASREKIGNVLRDQGDLVGALGVYRTAFAARQKLAASDQTNTGWQQDLAINGKKIGEVLHAQGQPVEALKSYREAMAISMHLASADPKNIRWLLDVKEGHQNIGDALFDQSDFEGALAAYRDALAIMRKLVEANSTNTVWTRDVSMCLERIGDAQRASGDQPGALVSSDEALKLRRKLADADPRNGRDQRETWMLAMKIASSLQKQDAAAAKPYWQQAFDRLSASKKAGLPMSEDDEKILSQLGTMADK